MSETPVDHHFRVPDGSILVRQASEHSPWLVTWLPDSPSHPGYPGFTLSSTDTDFPTNRGPRGLAEWAAAQPWAQPAQKSAPLAETEGEPIAAPAQEWREERDRIRTDFGWELTAIAEPDGSFTWLVYSADDELLQSGNAPTWDDARLEMIENLYPPSPEGQAG